MTETVKRICEFSKEYNRLMGLFCKITPTALKTVEEWKECTPDEEDCIGQHYYPVNVTKPCNTGGDLNIDGVIFPNSKEVEERVNMFYKDCDTLILNEKDSLLRKLCKEFSWYSLYPNEEQLIKEAMYNELNILDLLLDVMRTASDYKEYSFFIDGLTERRKVLLSQKKESSHDMESTNVSKQDNSKQERTDNESSINEQGDNKSVQRRRGRPIKPFDAVVAEQGSKGAIKSRLHALIDGKKGKGAVLYIKAAIILGLVQKPTHKQFITEFGDIVTRQQYDKCLREESYTTDEIEGAKIAIGKI